MDKQKIANKMAKLVSSKIIEGKDKLSEDDLEKVTGMFCQIIEKVEEMSKPSSAEVLGNKLKEFGNTVAHTSAADIGNKIGGFCKKLGSGFKAGYHGMKEEISSE